MSKPSVTQALYDGIIWDVVYEDESRIDLSIDDERGDFTVLGVPKTDVEFINKTETN